MTNTSVTLAETGIAGAINDGGGRRESARNKQRLATVSWPWRQWTRTSITSAARPSAL